MAAGGAGYERLASALKRAVRRAVSHVNLSVISHRDEEERHILDFVREIRHERRMEIFEYEAINLYRAAASIRHVDGDLAEVGCFEGASAKLIHLACPSKELHLFDTFFGLPESSRDEDGDRVPGRFAASMEGVRTYFSDCPKVCLHRGIFPTESGKEVQDRRFAFVHLDCDLAEFIAKSLEFFYPRMTTGALLICHDFQRGRTREVFGKFFADHVGTYLPISNRQGLFAKLS